MLLPAARSFPSIPLVRALRLGFYYLLLAYFFWLTLKPLYMAISLWQAALGDWRIAFMAVVDNFVVLALLFEALVIYAEDRSFARSSISRLLYFNASREADLFYWNACVSFLLLGLFSQHALGGLLPSINLWRIPMPFGGLVFFLVMSLITFTIHVLSHKIPALWELHKIHHSATELTMATGFREHFLTWGLNNLALSSLYRPDIGREMVVFNALMLGSAFLNLLQHSSLDFRFGWLGRVIVSPHAHRIHHLSDPRYHNRNFGTYLTLWDRLLGTYTYEASIPTREMDRSFGLAPEAGKNVEARPVILELFVSTSRGLAVLLGRRS